LKPFDGEICKSYVAVCPAVIVAEVEQFPPDGQFAPVAAASEKSVPVPVREIVRGLPGALSVIVTDAVRLPVSVGIKVTLMMQFELIGRVALLAGHVLV
jgi:hypothetical protein